LETVRDPWTRGGGHARKKGNSKPQSSCRIFCSRFVSGGTKRKPFDGLMGRVDKNMNGSQNPCGKGGGGDL